MGDTTSRRARTARAWIGLGILGMVETLAISPSVRAAGCEDLFAAQADRSLSDGRIFGAGVDRAREPNGHIRFGFESEYTLAESIPLLEIYGPHPRFGVSREAWLAMSGADRLEWVKQKIARIPEFGEESGLVLFVKEPGLEFMPETLVLDSTGNLEIVLPPVETYATWKAQVTAINARFGVGSQQAMVSSPSKPFFESWVGTGRVLDFLAFIHEFDTLQKLQGGGERYAKDATKPTALSFLHPFLGPMTAAKRTILERYVLRNSKGELFGDADLKFVRKSDASFKYIGGTVYRPDIGRETRLAFEVRDAHKNATLLDTQVQRLMAFFTAAESAFRGASRIGAFDPVATFAKLPLELQALVKDLAPAKTKPGFEYSPEEIEALQVYRNFSYPLRDWSAALEFLGRGDLAAPIQTARTQYLASLEAIRGDLAAGRIQKPEAVLRLQGAVSTFAVESGLPEAFQKWLEARAPKKEEAKPHAA